MFDLQKPFTNKNFFIQFHWVPGPNLRGNSGNAVADSLAKFSSNLNSPSFSLIPWYDFTSILHRYVSTPEISDSPTRQIYLQILTLDLNPLSPKS